MICSREAAKAIAKERRDAVVVSTMTPNLYWQEISSNPELDLPIFGAMGKASSVALGLALGQPDRKVIILDGDGAILMNLGSLVSIAGQRPENLIHFVFEDGVYFTTGGQPLPGAGKFELADIARGAGFAESYSFHDLETFTSELPNLMEKRGPVFVSLKVENPDNKPEFQMGNTAAAMGRLKATLTKH